ncbi:MAG: GNAT family N-acetyltransferase [archaeon]
MIRLFKQKDAKQCSKIMLDCIENNLKSLTKENKAFMIEVSQVEELIKKSNEIQLFVYEKNNEILGTGAFDNGEIRTMFIKPFLQGKGLGKEIINFLINLAKKKNFKKIFLKASPEAEKFYEKQGFKKTGENNDFNFRTILMERLI